MFYPIIAKSILKPNAGNLLIQCAKESHEKSLLRMKTFCCLKCKHVSFCLLYFEMMIDLRHSLYIVSTLHNN